MSTGRTVVWDLGGVVLRWEPIELVAQALAHLLPTLPGTPSAGALTSRLFDDFRVGGYWELFDRGQLDEEAVAERMAVRAGLPLAEVRRVLDAVLGHLALRPDAVALVERVRAAGHRVVYLSNMPARYAADLDPVLAEIFSAGVFSADVGLVKPDPEIYTQAAAILELDVRPDRLLFLDDRERNVAAARELGWPASRFTGVGACADELAAAGWLPAASATGAARPSR